MAYTALYRKWRPDNFADVKGQEAIVTTLKNQIANDRVGHAYLFCGTRGTGKTTIAKLLAKAVNCEHPVDGSPCGECAVCKAIANGSSLNVIEIDAASNNGVDNIRQIREEVSYRPTEGRYKVYIIDEVHMLSIGAFNALLKTLEEPPAYVMFILATTEAHKIPVTIASRCQRYDFKRINVETITARLEELVLAEQIPIEPRALRYIAKLADGAMRDALSLLDQCMSYYTDHELSYEEVLEVLGTVDTAVLSKMLRDVINGNVASLMTTLEELVLQGRDLGQFVADFTWYVRNLLMLKASPETESMLDLSAERMEELKEEAYALDEDRIMRYLRILSELIYDLRNSTNKRVQIEVALIKMTRPQMETDMISVKERLNRLEELVKEKEDMLALVAVRPAASSAAAVMTTEPVQTVKKQHIVGLPEDVRLVAERWKGVVGAVSELTASFLKDAHITAEDDKLIIVPGNSFSLKMISRESSIAEIKKAIEELTGKDIKIEVRSVPEGTSFKDNYDDLEEFVSVQIDVEDD